MDGFDYVLTIDGYEAFPDARRSALEQGPQATLRLRKLVINGRAVQIPLWKRNVDSWLRRLLTLFVPLVGVAAGYVTMPQAIAARLIPFLAYLLAIVYLLHHAGKILWMLAARRLVPAHYRLWMLQRRRARLSRVTACWLVPFGRRTAARWRMQTTEASWDPWRPSRMKTRRLLIGLMAGVVLVLALALFLVLDRHAYSPASAPLEASPDWIATGEGEASNFGFSVGTAGDANGDGYVDVIVGADRYKQFTGRLYVCAGSADGLGAAPAFTATGEQVNGHFGYSADTAGDVNRDGYDDLIVGADCQSNNMGRVYVYAGSTNGLSATPIFTAAGEGEGNHFGYAVSTAGDTNGDGYDDVVVGAYPYSDSTGRVYVYPGNADGLSITPVLLATGEGPASSFGRSVSTAGDVNGKGHADLIVGACGYDVYTGRAYVYLGEAE